MLSTELSSLDHLKQTLELSLSKEINEISNIVSNLSIPENSSSSSSSSSSKKKNDLYTWREVFRLYIESDIFFKSQAYAKKPRDAEHARERLLLFDSRVRETGIIKKFHYKGRGMEAYTKFFQLNIDLIKALRYQNLNKLAITKILKKFDKQTALRYVKRIKSMFFQFLQGSGFLPL